MPYRKGHYEDGDFGWYLVIDPKGREIAVLRSLTGALDMAFAAGPGSLTTAVQDRDGIPLNGSEPFYTAEPPEYMITLASGKQYGHFPSERACRRQAYKLGPGTTVHALGRELDERGARLIYTAD